MLVVPIEKDVITTTDGAKYKVTEYTNYKEAGPAVYARSLTSKETVLVYFVDIASINGTKVEFQKGSKVFEALGKIARSQPLPQPEDKIVVHYPIISHDDDEGKDQTRVAGLKLKSKAQGINKGMFVKGDDGDFYRLKQIIDIEPAIGSSTFNREAFLSTYKDYTGA